MITHVASPNTTLDIRRATPADAPVVARLFGALHAFNASLDMRFELGEGWESVLAEHLAHERAHGHGITLLSWQASRPIGMVMMDGHTESPLFRHRHWAELIALWVEPDARGLGVAHALVAEGLRWAGDQGYARVQLYVTASNDRARSFYAKSGFRPIQEIWCREIGHADQMPPDDPACEAVYAHGHHLLSTSLHHLTQVEPRCDVAGSQTGAVARLDENLTMRHGPRDEVEQ